MDTVAYDVLVMVTPKDFKRVECLYDRMVQYLPARKILFVGNEEVGKLVEKCKEKRWGIKEYADKIDFLDEEIILPFADVHAVMNDALKDILKERELPRGITGWYYQQFLKMNYAKICGEEYYLVWDGDTVPCRSFSMFREGTEVPYLDLKTEYHEEYFVTLQKLLPGMGKCIQKSFIAEHMLMKSNIMKDLIKTIESNDAIEGSTFWEKIIHAIDADKLMSNSFSEFETYGTFVCFRYQNAYRLRDWHSFRYGGEFFEMDQISEDDYQWLGRDFFAISFEKGHFVRKDHQNLFNNKYYQEKLSARQMLEISQQEFGEGSYQELWETDENAERWGRGYQDYERLGDNYSELNCNQAYLCYENAAYMCEDIDERNRLLKKKEAMRKREGFCVHKASIVIVSFNCMYMMQKCLESIHKTCSLDMCETIVVENASTDGVREWLIQQEDEKIILLDENVGFTIGCNIGIEYAEPNNDIFLLNNDTRLTPNALFWLRMGLYDRRDIGACGCVANYCGNAQEVDVQFVLPEEYVAYGAKNNIYMSNPYEERNRLSGFGMLIKREAWETTEGLDEAFSPGYMEDDDISLQIRKAGYRLLICHNSYIYHAGSQSFSKNNNLETIFTKNYIYLLEKWNFDVIGLSNINREAIKKIRREQFDIFSVLHIGAGCGTTLARIKYLYPNANVFGIETCKEAVEVSPENIDIVCSADWMEVLGKDNRKFDYIIVDEYIEDGDLERFLNQDGKVIKYVQSTIRT